MHLGARSGADVLRSEPRYLRRLLEAADEADQLVLLGDVLELRQGPMREALRAARPVLAEIGETLGAGRRVVVVPGNHDHHLISGWVQRGSRDQAPPPIGLDAQVDWVQGEPLAAVAAALEPAELEVRYPGLWLREDVYATHGHYLDRHTTVPMFERLAAGAMTRIVGSAGDPSRGAEGYEAVLAPMYAWIHELAQHGGPQLGRSSHGASGQAWRALEGSRGSRRSARGRALAAAFPLVVAALDRSALGPLRADISGSELRRAALSAIGEVVRSLKISAGHVVFGHTHRAGPLPADAGAEWITPGGSGLVNCGSWVYERAFLGERPAVSPYRPGFCAMLDDGGPPRLQNLLDGLSADRV